METVEIDVPTKWMSQEERRKFEARQQRDRAYSQLVRSIQWQLFGTFTFPGVVYHDEWADKEWVEYINRLESSLKSDIYYIRADERRLSGCGKPVCGLHFHTLLASAAPMHPAFVEWLWTSQVGQRKHDAGAFVVPYNPIQGGAEYLMKMITADDPEADWTFRKLHLFHPEARESYQPTARFRRNLRRLEMQHTKFSSAPS